MSKLRSLVLAFAVFAMPALAAEPVVGLPCEGCEAVFEGMPKELASRGRIAPRGETGQPMVLTGRVLGTDGKPRADVVVYAYQTDARGIYPEPQKSLGRWPDRHGRLRGWAVSGPDGIYAFDTIRPASYPNGQVPQHIHMHVIERGCATYYIDEVVFTDDPFLTADEREGQPGRGGSGVVTPRRDAGGTWQAVRDIHLGQNIPGYPACKPRR